MVTKKTMRTLLANLEEIIPKIDNKAYVLKIHNTNEPVMYKNVKRIFELISSGSDIGGVITKPSHRQMLICVDKIYDRCVNFMQVHDVMIVGNSKPIQDILAKTDAIKTLQGKQFLEACDVNFNSSMNHYLSELKYHVLNLRDLIRQDIKKV